MLARVQAATTAEIDGFLVQEQIFGAVEKILGFNRRPQHGAYVVLGAGGVTTELYKDVSLRLLPLNLDAAHKFHPASPSMEHRMGVLVLGRNRP